MIKYLGSKRRLVPVLAEICGASGARTALDLFTGTTRVAQAFKAQGRARHRRRQRPLRPRLRPHLHRGGCRRHRYGRCRRPSPTSTRSPASRATCTRRSAVKARFFQPHNAARIDAVRDAIESEYAGSPLFPLLLTSLIEAADRVDSTTGVQMAYVKQWAPRSFNPLELRVPALLEGPGRAVRGDAVELAADARALRPGLPRSAVQPAPVFHQLPRVGDAGGLGCARGLRRGPQAGGRPRPVHALGVQLEADHARRPGLGGPIRGLRPVGPVLQRRVLARTGGARGDVRSSRAKVAAGPAPAARRREVATLPSTPPDTSGPASASSTRPGARSGRVGHLSNQELLVIAGEPAMVRRVVGRPPVAATLAMADRLQQAT